MIKFDKFYQTYSSLEIFSFFIKNNNNIFFNNKIKETKFSFLKILKIFEIYF
jgi:hypothetical protein